MLDILFFYAKEHPDLTYRQGMHELLAPILFVLHAENREDITHAQSLMLVSSHYHHPYTYLHVFLL